MRISTQKIHHGLTILLAFSLPLYRHIPPVLIALLFINWLIEGNWKEKIANYKIHRIALLPCLLYILYCIGMLYTENMEFGMKDLETKLSFLLLPLIFASKPSLTKEETDKVFQGFILGCATALLFCFFHSLYIYFDEMYRIHTGKLNNTGASTKYFLSSDLSYFIHPSYFAMYLGLCCAYILQLFTLKMPTSSNMNKLILSIILVVFSISIVFLASKMGIIVFLFICLWAIMYIVFKKKYYVLGIGFILFLTGSALFLYKNSEILASRLNVTLNTLESQKLDKTSTESSTVRILIWEQAVLLLKKNLISGVGTGDIKDVLLEKYKQEGMTGAFDHKLNVHNQFLQTSLTIGLPAGLFLILCLLIPLIISINTRNPILSFFILSFVLNILVESMFEVQAGVLFYAFFNSIFLSTLSKNNE